MDGTGTNDLVVRDRILRATLEWIADTGLVHLSMHTIARRARLARATLYLHFPGREALITAAVETELKRFFADVTEYLSRYDEPADRMIFGFAHAYRLLRSHRTLNAVLETNPQILLPFVVGPAPAIAFARRHVSTFLESAGIPDSERDQIAEHIVRTYHTLILAPASVFDLDAEDGPEGYARQYLLPLLKRFSGD